MWITATRQAQPTGSLTAGSIGKREREAFLVLVFVSSNLCRARQGDAHVETPSLALEGPLLMAFSYSDLAQDTYFQ